MESKSKSGTAARERSASHGRAAGRTKARSTDFFFFSSRRRHTRLTCDWSSDVCSSEVSPQDITEDMLLEYLVYLAKTLGCSRVKCRMAAQSIAFFCRHVLKRPYVIPSVIYPRASATLPPVMSAEEMKELIETVKNVKHRTIIMLLYSSGLRVSEIAHLKIVDIDSK